MGEAHAGFERGFVRMQQNDLGLRGNGLGQFDRAANKKSTGTSTVR
jgi:hypothetical protein